MKILSQQDPQWAKFKLGQSSLTVGRYGCTTTCLSMLSDYYGVYKDPVAIQGFLKYTPDGLIIWESLNLSPMKFGKRLRERNDAEIQISLKDPKKAVILEVNHSHWVVATSKFLGNTYWIADPWTGTRRLSTAYNGNITGSAHFYKL